MALPNFVIVGFPKCGTTSLHYYLDDHPEIFMPRQKELHYFTSKKLLALGKGPGDNRVNTFHISSFKDYKKHFNNTNSKHKAIGEVSPSYINYPEVIPTIKKTLGHDLKIIIVLRDPIQRTFSNYLHLVREGRETLTFYEALQKEDERKEQRYSDFWYYKWNSMYAEKVKYYQDAFDAVHVLTQEELKHDLLETLRKVYHFLGVDSTYTPKNLSKQYNPGGLYKDNLITKLIFRQSGLRTFIKKYLPITSGMKSLKQRVLKQYESPKPEIDQRSKAYLVEYFKDDVKRLKKYVDLNIDYWNPKF